MADSQDRLIRLAIGDLTLYLEERRVTRDGDDLHLGKLTYDLLLALAERAPALVTQEELAQRVWTGRAASPETIQQRVKILRQSLGDDAKAPRYIRVARGQGYQLIPPVDFSSASIGRAARWSLSGWLVSAGVMVAVSLTIGLIVAGSDLERTHVDRESLQQAPTSSAEAHAIYLDVIAQFDVGRNVEGLDVPRLLERNIASLGRAIELDPAFADAYVLRGAQHAVRADIGRLGRSYFDADRELELAATDFEHALAIDSELATAHSSLASIDLLRGDVRRARERFKRALRLSPNDPLVLGAVADYYLGENRRGDARALLLKVIEIEPNIAATSPTLDGALMAAGDLDAAAELNWRFVDANPASVEANLSLGYVEAIRGNRDTALKQLDLGMKLLDQNPGALPGLPEWLAGLTYVYGRLGHDEQAQRFFDRLVDLVPDERHIQPVQWVRAYLGIDDLDKAYEWAQELAAQPRPLGHSHELHFMLNSENDPRLDRPEFVELRKQLGDRD
jgi:tetratricopeptide (TPR) repeat protein